MTPDELLHLIAQGEGQRLEFKRSLAELEDGVCTMAWIVARLNVTWVN